MPPRTSPTGWRPSRNLKAARSAAWNAGGGRAGHAGQAARASVAEAAWVAARQAQRQVIQVVWKTVESHRNALDEKRDAQRRQCDLLRDMFGNPFRPLPPPQPLLLAWDDALVVKMAAAIYEERLLPSGHLENLRLAVLSDALQDAGCTDESILDHLRGPGPHVRGCHVVDLILGLG